MVASLEAKAWDGHSVLFMAPPEVMDPPDPKVSSALEICIMKSAGKRWHKAHPQWSAHTAGFPLAHRVLAFHRVTYYGLAPHASVKFEAFCEFFGNYLQIASRQDP